MATIRKRILPSGQTCWLADYTDASGKRRAKQFMKKADAEAYLTEVRYDLSRGMHIAPGASITVAKAGALWIERAERDRLQQSTIRQYMQHLKHHIEPEIGSMKLSEVTRPRVHEFLDALLETRSRAMARKVITSLGSIFEEALIRGLATYNPATSIKIRAPSLDRADLDMPTKDELRAILNNASGRWRPIIVTAMFTGMRGSELRGLTWEHVDLDTGMIQVRQRADAWGTFGPPKSKAGKRDIPMSPLVLNTLKEWKLACPRGPDNPLGLVFPSPTGGVIAHACILKDGFWPLQIRAGVVINKAGKDGNRTAKAKFSLHALRHAAAALFIEQRLSPKRVQQLMGHASITLTYDVYGYLFPAEEDDKEAMAQIEARLLK